MKQNELINSVQLHGVCGAEDQTGAFNEHKMYCESRYSGSDRDSHLRALGRIGQKPLKDLARSPK